MISVGALSSQHVRSPTSFSDYTGWCFLSMKFLYPLMSHSEEIFFLHLNANNIEFLRTFFISAVSDYLLLHLKGR